MSFIEAVQSAFAQCLDFNGRARKSEYWYFMLFNMIVGIVLAIIEIATGINFLIRIWSFVVFLPTLAVRVRRLHDIGKSGWYYCSIFIPIVGGFLLLAWMCTDSEPDANQYGPNPESVY